MYRVLTACQVFYENCLVEIAQHPCGGGIIIIPIVQVEKWRPVPVSQLVGGSAAKPRSARFRGGHSGPPITMPAISQLSYCSVSTFPNHEEPPNSQGV